MTWTCKKCGETMVSLNDCIQHVVKTSGHLNFDPNAGTPIDLDMSFLMHDSLHNCFDSAVQNLQNHSGHPNRDFLSLYCSGEGSGKCPIDGRDECNLDFEDRSKIGYHEFHSIGNIGHHFSMHLNLPLVEILFSKGYPSVVSKLKTDIETEEARFKTLEKEGKAFRMGYMQFGVPEGDSWNVVTQCKKCSRWQKLPMLVSKPPQNMPQNLFSMGFTCSICGYKDQITPKDCLDRSEFTELLLAKLIESNPKIAEQFSELSNPNAKSNNPVYG